MAIRPTLVSGIIVLALTGYFGYYNRIFLPTQHTVRELRSQLSQEQETQTLRVEVARSLDALERFRKRLTPEPNTEWLVREVSTLAEEAGIRLTAIVPQTPKQLQELTHLAVSLQFVVSYHQLGKFLSTVENSPIFIRVEELEVTRRSDDVSPASVRMTLSTVYVPPFAL